MSNSRFTKIYDKERELLYKTKSVTAYEVYFHLKGDNSYFKKEFMDLRRCIAAYLNIPERTVKDALQRLIKVGLIKTNKRGKVNYYTLPYDTDIKENRKEDEQPIIQETGEEDKEHLNRREEQTGSKENEILSEETEGGNGGNEEYVVEDYIDKHINKVLIPLLQNDGDKYYENINRLILEVQKVFPDIQFNDLFSMIDNMVRIRNKKAV